MKKYYILRRKKKKLDDGKQKDDLKAQKDLLDKSSDINRNQGLFLVGFMLYILITTASITDLQLVFWDEANDKGGIAIPFISAFTLPVSSFAWVVPIVILGLHLNLLLHLREHNIKLGKWIACLTEKATDLAITQQLQPFLFNYTLSDDKGFVVGVTKMLVNLAVFFLPMITLFYVEYRFADMHDRVLTTWQFVFLLADACLVQYFYTQIVEPDKTDKWWRNPETMLVIGYRLPRLGVLYIMKIFKRKGFGIHLSEHLSIVRFWDKAFYRAALYCSVLYLFLVYIISSPHHYKACVAWERGDDVSVVCRLLRGDSLSFASRMLGGDSTLYSSYDSLFVPGQSKVRWKLSLMPTIDVHGEKLVQSTPDEKEILMAEQNGHNKDTFVLDNTKGIHINNRDFTMANFSGCNMIKLVGDSLKAPYSNWERCNANQAQMQKVDMDYAFMDYINLDSAKMWGSLLRHANLHSASFQDEVDLGDAQMQGANLIEAQMQGAYLSHARMQGADLVEAQMQGADLDEAQMQGAELDEAQMQGADLDEAQMQGAYLSGAQMQWANLFEAQMQGTVLWRTNLYQVANWNPDTTINICNVNLRNAGLTTARIAELDATLHKYNPMEWSTGQFKELISAPNKNAPFLKTMDNKVLLPPLDSFAKARAGLLADRDIPLRFLFFADGELDEINTYYIARHNQILRDTIIQQKLSWRKKEFNDLLHSSYISYPGLTEITDKELK